jgi:hypothetical protein
MALLPLKARGRDILGYALGEGVTSLTLNGISGFAMLYYTQALGLPFAQAGVADAVEAHSKLLGASPTEYAGDVLRWWFGQGCPPVTHDEAALLEAAIKTRVKPLPANLNVWALDEKSMYTITEDHVVETLLLQMRLPNLFARALEHDEIRMCVVFDNHPTHWLMLDFYKGGATPDMNGLAFTAYPKVSTIREEMLKKMAEEAKRMESKSPLTFSQIPMLEKQHVGNQSAPKGVPAL